ncbi:uncharacterized protein Pyn_23505 [Prunus yedoensis var. nudiflora]|uniref:Uncharacterized protein n=1 Tax=Prunus yedoensis var. nudiflora TaxID=2094558 RepID=A0A314ZNG7_PRUYE|nr:uncharacterized protein Pyn_23505 [Prunus yedoensis var. nudiflora]
MRPDGKILEYRADTKVYQVLSEFSGHAISETAPVYQHLRPDTKLLGGRLYYLVPLRCHRKRLPRRRIKIVISKKELQEMLRKGGVSVDDLVSQLQSDRSIDKTNSFNDDGNCEGWKPVLESIPELN